MKNLGKSIALLGGVIFFSGIVIAPFFDALAVDLIAFFLMMMGVELLKGQRTAILWPSIWSGWYCLISGLLLVMSIISPEKVNLGKLGLDAGVERAVVASLLLTVLAWSGLNLYWLLKFRKNYECRTTSASE